jgi:hypothetical protein
MSGTLKTTGESQYGVLVEIAHPFAMTQPGLEHPPAQGTHDGNGGVVGEDCIHGEYEKVMSVSPMIGRDHWQYGLGTLKVSK